MTVVQGRRWAVAIGLFCASLMALTLGADAASGMLGATLAQELPLIVAFNAYLVVGLILIARRPSNALGWLLVAVGVLINLGGLAESWSRYALVISPGAPLGVLAAWYQTWWWYLNLAGVLIFLPLLFPTGRPPSRRWRWVLIFAAVDIALLVLVAMCTPELADEEAGYRVTNPIGIDIGVEDVEEGPVGAVLLGGLVVSMVLSVASLVVRWRSSRGVERQQLKWFVFAATIVIVEPLFETTGLLPAWWVDNDMVFAVEMALPPVAIGLAVTRYRLYEIDRLISRTLTYALVTAVLVALYLGAVAGLSTVTASAAGDSSIAVAAATLLAAGAFGPVRRRVQNVVDRRFNRSRYDATRTVELFRGTLRDEVDLGALSDGLVGVVGAAVQPQASVLWLAPTMSMDGGR